MIARAPETFACEWDIDESGFGVCKTRKRLKDAVVDATRMRSGEARVLAFQMANEAYYAHECGPVPVVDRGVGQDVVHAEKSGIVLRPEARARAPEEPAPSPVGDTTPEDIEVAADRYADLYHRSRTAADLRDECDKARRALLAKVEIYRAEASRDGARAHFQRLLREVEHG